MHLQILKLLCPRVKEEMHLQKIFDLTLPKCQYHIKHCPLHHVTYVPAKFEVAMVKEMHYEENTLFDLDPKVKGFKVTQKVAQCPRLYGTYVPPKFAVATSYG